MSWIPPRKSQRGKNCTSCGNLILILHSLGGGHGHSGPAACSQGSQEQIQERLVGLDPAGMGNVPAWHHTPHWELVLPAWSAGIEAVGVLLYSQVSLAIQSNPPPKKKTQEAKLKKYLSFNRKGSLYKLLQRQIWGGKKNQNPNQFHEEQKLKMRTQSSGSSVELPS